MCAAVSIAAVGVAVSVLTGGTALPIYMAAAAVTLGSGGTAASMGISDVLEGVQDICYGSTGSETASTNLIRDYVYQGNYDVYYFTEIGSVMVASQGMAILGNVPKSEGAGSLSNVNPSVRSAFGSDAKVTTLTKDTTVYRYHGGTSQASGRWFTPNQTTNPAADLALPPGNSAQFVDTVVLPKGTRILEGTVAPQPQWGQPGGGYQYYVLP